MKSASIFLLPTAILYFANASACLAQDQPINFAKPNCDLIINEIIRATNAARAEHQLSPLERSIQLTAAAQSHANDMVNQGFFSHDNPHNDERRTMQQRIALTGFEGRTGYAMAENITINWGIRYDGESVDVSTPGVLRNAAGEILPHSPRSLAKALVKQWMESPGHRANILRPNLKMGAGLAFYVRKDFNDIVAVKACQVFGTPAKDTPEVDRQLANTTESSDICSLVSVENTDPTDPETPE